MRRITQRELRNQSAAIMDTVERGETLVVTRHGVEVAEIRPVTPSPFVRTEDAVEKFRHLPPFDLAKMRSEEDAFFGPDDLER